MEWKCAKGGSGSVQMEVVGVRCVKGGGGSGGLLKEVVGVEVC